MLISDWSSDVCSSDLVEIEGGRCGADGAVPMQKEVPLDRRRWSDARPDALGETRRQPVLAGKEGEEQPAQLVLIAEPEFQPDVYPARPDQRRVESFGVVGRHEQEPPLLRRDAVERDRKSTR